MTGNYRGFEMAVLTGACALLSPFGSAGAKVLVIIERGDVEVTNADSRSAPPGWCAEPPAGVPQLASYVDVKVPAKYWVDMTWQDGEWRPAAHIPMPHHHATRLELTNVTEFAALARHRDKRVRLTVEVASRDIRKVPGRNQWRATYHARILALCVPRA
jgi:hypothetical protein